MPSAAVDQSGGAIDGAVVGAFSGLWVDEEVVAEQSRGVVASFERSEPGEVLGGNARASTSGPVADSKLKYMPSMCGMSFSHQGSSPEDRLPKATTEKFASRHPYAVASAGTSDTAPPTERIWKK